MYSARDRNDLSDYIPETDENELERRSIEFDSFRPKNKLSTTSDDIKFARKMRDRNVSRSQSASRSGEFRSSINQQQYENHTNKVSGLSIHLQLDQERFVERRRTFDVLERKKAQDDENYQNYLQQRFLRASMKGGRIQQNVAKRNQEWLQQNVTNRNLKLQEKLHQEKELLQNYKQQLHAHIKKPLPKYDRLWSEIELDENQKRKDRIEKRKIEIANISRYPLSSSSIDLIQRKQQNNNNNNNNNINGRSQSAPHTNRNNPNKNNYGNTDDSSGINIKKSLTNEEFVQLMETRQKEVEQRKQQRLLKKHQKNLLEEEIKKKTEYDKMMKLIKNKLPSSCERTTKAAEDRVKITKKKIEDQRRQELVEQQKQEKLLKRQKEITHVLKSIIQLNENDRKSKHGGYIELSHTESLAAQKARQNKVSYQAAIRANQKRIEDVLENRPTLLQRHDEYLAKQAANKRALETLDQITQQQQQQSMNRTSSSSSIHSRSSTTMKKHNSNPTTTTGNRGSNINKRGSNTSASANNSSNNGLEFDLDTMLDDIKSGMLRSHETRTKDKDSRSIYTTEESKSNKIDNKGKSGTNATSGNTVNSRYHSKTLKDEDDYGDDDDFEQLDTHVSTTHK